MTAIQDLLEGEIKLFSLPEVYMRLKALLDDPDYSLADVGALIGQDPALTTRLLKLVNSPLFGSASKIDTVSQAVTMVGTQQVHDLVLATSVTQSFSGMKIDIVDMKSFWTRSVRCAVAARILANRCDLLDCERLFVTGLLSHVGHMPMYHKMPKDAERALLESKLRPQRLFQVERELLGFDYAQIGAELARIWELPTFLQTAIAHHNSPQSVDEFKLETAIVFLAALLAEVHDWQGGMDEWPNHVPAGVWQETELSPTDIVELREEIEIGTTTSSQMLLPGLMNAA